MKKTVPGICAWLCLLLGISATSTMRTGCKQSAREEAKVATEPRSVEFLQQKMQGNAAENIRQLAARARISVTAGGNAQQAVAQLIWQRDSALWISLRKLGIEGVRLLATRDSVVLLNRIDKTFSVQTWEQIQQAYHLPAGFSLLETVVLGQPWRPSGMLLQSEVKEGMHRLWGRHHRYLVDYRIEEGTFRVRQMTFLEQIHARAVSLIFDNFQKTEGTTGFSYLRHIDVIDPENGNTQIEIELSDVEINASKVWRFDVPQHYRRER